MNETTNSTSQNLPWQLTWRVRLTLAGLFVEIVWSALWPATGFIGAYLTLSFFDLWLHVPGVLQLVCLVSAFGAAGFSLFRTFRPYFVHKTWPTRADALRRMELSGDLFHRPLTELGDEMSEAVESEDSALLWRAHKRRQREALMAARSAGPKSDLADRDPHALRVMVAMVLIFSLFVAGGDWGNRLGLAFQPSLSFTSGHPVHVTAWVNPPEFTGLAPSYLAADTSKDRIAVPQNSALIIRVTDARGTPALIVSSPAPGQPAKIRAEKTSGGQTSGGHYEITYALKGSGDFKLKDRGRKLGLWRFAVTPDAAPFAAFQEEPTETDSNGLGFAYELHDDYGIGSASLSMSLAMSPAMEIDSKTTSEDLSEDRETERHFEVALPLPSGREKSISERTVLDLTAHYYAGLDVEGQIIVKDLGGQEGRSEVVRFSLPERQFFEPLALAIVEQRRNLAHDPTDWAYVMRAIEALTLAPERFYDDLTVYTGLRTAYWQLDRTMPKLVADAVPTIDLLWDLALHVEDGNLSLAAQELRAIAKALQDALARGAPMDEIRRLLQRYQEALERYLAALAEKSLADAADAIEPPESDGTTIDQQDLMDLLKAIEDLARTGDTAAASELMAQLQRMLENMTMSAQGGMNGPESELAGKIEDLSDLIGKQRALMDETLRRSQDEGSDASPDAGAQPGLADEQGDLQNELGELEGGDPDNEAGEAMQDAEDALRGGETRRALHDQRRAVDAMRETAEGLAEALQKSMEARGAGDPGGQPLDPLGRAEGGSGQGPGDHIKIPQERDLQRAREILKELQERASDPDRPQIELDYLERLLKRF